MIESIYSAINDYCAKKDLEAGAGGSLRHLLVRGYSNLIIFFFLRNGKNPVAVAKIDRFKRGILAKENRVLSQIVKEPKISKTVPDPIIYIDDRSGECIVESALPGMNLVRSKNILDRAYLDSLMQGLCDWLVELQSLRGVTMFCTIDEDMVSKLYGDMENVAEKKQSSRTIFKNYNKDIKRLFGRIRGKSIPSVLLHGDFWADNILLDNGNIGIVDWDKAEEKGFPVCDLFDFCLQIGRLYNSSFAERYKFYMDRVDRYADDAFFSGGISEILVKWVTYYCKRLNIDRDMTEVIFLWYMVTKYGHAGILDLFFSKKRIF